MKAEAYFMKLNNGLTIPDLGYGTWLIANENAFECVTNAIKCGYRHIDSAQDYRNEQEVGRAIRECGLSRKEIFLTTKVASHHKDYLSAKRSIEESLAKLNVEYIDLLLIHCPCPWPEYGNRQKDYFNENLMVWKAMEEFVEQGKVKSIGISNFNIEDTKNILEHGKIKPVVNQIPLWIGNTNKPLIKYCQENGVEIEAYSPIAHGRAIDNPLIQDMAKKYNVSVANLCIKYTLQLGTISLPKASQYNHMKENMFIDFTISDEDMEFLSNQVE